MSLFPITIIVSHPGTPGLHTQTLHKRIHNTHYPKQQKLTHRQDSHEKHTRLHIIICNPIPFTMLRYATLASSMYRCQKGIPTAPLIFRT
jgi:hypothetical protein